MAEADPMMFLSLCGGRDEVCISPNASILPVVPLSLSAFQKTEKGRPAAAAHIKRSNRNWCSTARPQTNLRHMASSDWKLTFVRADADSCLQLSPPQELIASFSTFWVLPSTSCKPRSRCSGQGAWRIPFSRDPLPHDHLFTTGLTESRR